MADGASELESKILRLRVRYDGMADSRVADKKALEDEIRGLQDQLAELQHPTPVAPQPPPPDPMVREANQDIGAVKDILGAEDDLTRLQRQLAKERASRDDLLKQPYTIDTPDYIRDSDNAIRDLEHQINALNPVTEDLDLLSDSAAVIAGREAMEKRQREAEAAKRATDAAAQATRDAYTQAGPSERALIDEQKTLDGYDNPTLEQQLVDARTKDDALAKGIKEGRKAGCATSPTVLAGIGIGAAVVIAVILVLLNAGGDDKKSPVSAGGAQQSSAAGGGDTGGATGDLANFAGHYVIASGFKDPKTTIAFQLSNAYNPVTVTEADGEFDVDATGKITAGRLHVKDHAVSPNLTCDFAFDSTVVSGNVGVSGDVGAIGQIVWTGTHTTSLCSDSVSESAQIYQIGIVADEVTVCGTNMQPTLKDCQDPYPHVVGTFVKQG